MASPSLEQYNSLFAQNVTLSNQFKQLITEYRNKNASINAAVNTMIAKVNSVVANMGSSVFRPVELFFNRNVSYTKDGFGITADLKDATQSNWVKVFGHEDAKDLFTAGSLTVVHPVRTFSFNGGARENPQYATDKSRTFMQFIVANENASSDQINCEIDVQGLTISNVGSWSSSARSFAIHSLNITGLVS